MNTCLTPQQVAGQVNKQQFIWTDRQQPAEVTEQTGEVTSDQRCSRTMMIHSEGNHRPAQSLDAHAHWRARTHTLRACLHARVNQSEGGWF